MKLADGVTYTTVIAVAIIEALNETLRVDPKVAANLPSFLTSGTWNFVPLLLLLLVGLISLAKQLRWRGGSNNGGGNGGVIPPDTKIATENIHITYQIAETIIINQAPAAGSQVEAKAEATQPTRTITAKVKDTAEVINKFLTPGVASGDLGLEVDRASLKLKPDELELLDAENVKSVRQSTYPDGRKLLKIDFYEPMKNPTFGTAYSTSSAALPAAFSEVPVDYVNVTVEKDAPLVDVYFISVKGTEENGS